ncbi:MAG: hypothetical protein L3J28_11220 [Candidatus Polarisedimenticolaceae bacterium]|nr:hypothetical protein [Candidatus Polarisedimenticolaceae bacterium]
MNRVVKKFDGVRGGAIALFAAIFGGLIFAGTLQANDAPELHPAIHLLDESGTNVLESSKAYSPRKSCGGGGCHDYDIITHAYHFEMGRDEARDDFGAERGVPQLVSPGYFGGYNCMGGNNPDQLSKKVNASIDDFADKGSAGWIQRCVGCHNGGGWMELDRNGVRYDETDPSTVTEFDGDYYNRGTDENNQPTDDESIVTQWDWKKSGVVEADCFICHADFREMVITDPEMVGGDSGYDHFRDLRRGQLIDEGFFRVAGTAILEFINLNHPECGVAEGDGCATTDISLLNFDRTVVPDSISVGWDGSASGPDYALNLDADGQPVINWNASAFNAEGEVVIPMLRFPANGNCMMCHRTGNSRRAFYGFGDEAESTEDEDGLIVEDYKDDVHKGKLWTENGVERKIEVCNTCHGRNYFRNGGSDLDADHNFPKGNSDMELRNDLDYKPDALSCEYCHDQSENAIQANPSDYEDMLTAHLERWKFAGDMAGYPGDEETLTRITQTHLDVVSCQACHITDKADRNGDPMKIMYRYRQAADGKQTIVPYNPKVRSFWRDKNTGVVLNKTERNSVFVLMGGEDHESSDDMDMDMGDEQHGMIVDLISGAELGQVSVRMSHGSLRFGDPEDYGTFLALKTAYDSVLSLKGVETPDAVQVWADTAMYLMSHNTRPAVSSVQCEECHDTRQDGAISALVSQAGLFGTGELATKAVASILDPRLVSEGVVILDMPYMKLSEVANEDGEFDITENVSDILYASRVDPSMSILASARAKVMVGKMDDPVTPAETTANSGITNQDDVDLLNAELTGTGYYQFAPQYGDDEIRRVALVMESNHQTDPLIPTYKMEIAVAKEATVTKADGAGFGGLVSPVISLEAFDIAGGEVSHFNGNRMLVKLPYDGSSDDLEQVRIITSADGETWTMVDPDNIVLVRPKTNLADGYVAFWTEHFSYYAVADTTIEASSTTTATTSASSSDGGGGALGWPLLMLGLIGLAVVRRKNG